MLVSREGNRHCQLNRSPALGYFRASPSGSQTPGQPCGAILRVKLAQARDVCLQRRDQAHRQNRRPIFVALAAGNDQLPPCEIHVLHAQPQQLHQSQFRTVGQLSRQPHGAFQCAEELSAFVSAEHHRHATTRRRTLEIELPDLLVQSVVQQEHQGVQACFWVDGVARCRTARAERNAPRSSFVAAHGVRRARNWLKRTAQPRYVCSVRQRNPRFRIAALPIGAALVVHRERRNLAAARAARRRWGAIPCRPEEPTQAVARMRFGFEILARV